MRIAIAAETVAANEWPSGFHVAPFDAILHALAARELLNLAYQDGGGEILAWGDWWPSVESDPEYDEALCFVVLEESSNNLAAFAPVPAVRSIEGVLQFLAGNGHRLLSSG